MIKRFFKTQWLIILILVASASIILNSTAKYMNNWELQKQANEQMIAKCEIELETQRDPQAVEVCEQMQNNKSEERDFYTMMTDILVFDLQYLNLISFLLLLIPSLFLVNKYLKSNTAKTMLLRESYPKYIKGIIKKTYRYIWILPAIALIFILICVSKTSLNPSYGLTNNTSMWMDNIVYQPFFFIIIYLLNILFHSILYLNIGLITLRKHHNYFTSLIISFIAFLGIELFFEAIISGVIFNMILKSGFGMMFNIMNLFTFSTVYGWITTITFSILWASLSSYVVYLAYKNKEKFVIDCEKNN